MRIRFFTIFFVLFVMFGGGVMGAENTTTFNNIGTITLDFSLYPNLIGNDINKQLTERGFHILPYENFLLHPNSLGLSISTLSPVGIYLSMEIANGIVKYAENRDRNTSVWSDLFLVKISSGSFFPRKNSWFYFIPYTSLGYMSSGISIIKTGVTSIGEILDNPDNVKTMRLNYSSVYIGAGIKLMVIKILNILSISVGIEGYLTPGYLLYPSVGMLESGGELEVKEKNNWYGYRLSFSCGIGSW